MRPIFCRDLAETPRHLNDPLVREVLSKKLLRCVKISFGVGVDFPWAAGIGRECRAIKRADVKAATAIMKHPFFGVTIVYREIKNIRAFIAKLEGAGLRPVLEVN